MGKFVKLATTDEMANQPARCIEVEGQKIALFKSEDAFCALSDTCTHRGGPLSEGMWRELRSRAPWHGAKFDLRTGAVLGPPARTGVKSYPVRVTGRDIEVEISISYRAHRLRLIRR